MTKHTSAVELFEPSLEERFLWDCARSWREPASIAMPGGLDWARVVSIGRDNRMQTLLVDLIRVNGWAQQLPAQDWATLEADAAKTVASAEQQATALREYLAQAAALEVETVVLKGLSVSINVYGDAAMRPGGDIDILVRRRDVAASLAILDRMGIGRNWPNLMDDAYYERHHLHQQRCTADLKIWFEIHWALDHPLTLLTIDYEEMIDRARAGTLLGEPVRELTPPDLLLSLAIHLVKHAVYLPSVVGRADLARIVLADGMAMYFLDVAELIGLLGGEMDWSRVIALTRSSGAVDIVGSVLAACAHLLDARVPEWVLEQLAVRGPGGLTRRTMEQIVAYESATYLGQQPSGIWEFLLVTNGAFILRPIRALDLTAYLFPDADYLRRRYGEAGPGTRVSHAFRAAGQYARLGFDTVAFTWERYRRLKRLHQSASLFNRLEVEP